MYNRRVSKCDAHIEACGAVDELTANIGVARAAGTQEFLRLNLRAIQNDLITLMGELATAPEDIVRYSRDGFPRINSSSSARLNALVTQLEQQTVTTSGWAIPGENRVSAALDVARTVCRRAERRVCALHDAGVLENEEILVFLNRLSDTLWLLARWVERQPAEH
jgi:cob(I)alamin adenosyltransferase